jgi:hypothetical protein
MITGRFAGKLTSDEQRIPRKPGPRDRRGRPDKASPRDAAETKVSAGEGARDWE